MAIAAIRPPTMYLVQLLLPLYDPQGRPFKSLSFRRVSRELTGRFGGLTTYARSPATGLWQERPGHTTRDEVVVYEVMVESLDRNWWGKYRRTLEKKFKQQELVIRAQEIERM